MNINGLRSSTRGIIKDQGRDVVGGRATLVEFARDVETLANLEAHTEPEPTSRCGDIVDDRLTTQLISWPSVTNSLIDCALPLAYCHLDVNRVEESCAEGCRRSFATFSYQTCSPHSSSKKRFPCLAFNKERKTSTTCTLAFLEELSFIALLTSQTSYVQRNLEPLLEPHTILHICSALCLSEHG